MPQTLSEIRSLLTAAGLSPLKRFGQNFLIDHNLLGKLVDAAGVGPSDVVLEVGPGTGTLTEHLLSRAGQVVSVEIDRGLQAICRERFADCPNFTLIAGDVMARKSQIAPELLDALRRERDRLGGRAMLVANLPYQVATPLLIELMMGELLVSPMCFTVQAEVGERLIATQGKEYGPISVIAQALGSLSRIARVPPQSFWPAPTVDSIMMKWEANPKGRLAADALANLSRIMHHCFMYRRKMLRSSLRTLLTLDQLQTVETSGEWDLGLRPEQISVERWLRLSVCVQGGATE